MSGNTFTVIFRQAVVSLQVADCVKVKLIKLVLIIYMLQWDLIVLFLNKFKKIAKSRKFWVYNVFRVIKAFFVTVSLTLVLRSKINKSKIF